MAAKTATKSRKTNKSSAIVKYFESHPDAKPRDIATALSKGGTKISPGYVSTILFNYRKKKSKGKRGRPAGTKRRATGTLRTGSDNQISANEIMLAKELVDKSGSVGAARKALDLYGDIIA